MVIAISFLYPLQHLSFGEPRQVRDGFLEPFFGLPQHLLALDIVKETLSNYSAMRT